MEVEVEAEVEVGVEGEVGGCGRTHAFWCSCVRLQSHSSIYSIFRACSPSLQMAPDTRNLAPSRNVWWILYWVLGLHMETYGWENARFLISSTRPTWFCASGQNPQTFRLDARMRLLGTRWGQLRARLGRVFSQP